MSDRGTVTDRGWTLEVPSWLAAHEQLVAVINSLVLRLTALESHLAVLQGQQTTEAEPKVSGVSYAPTTGPASKPWPSPGASQDSSPALLAEMAQTLASFRSIGFTAVEWQTIQACSSTLKRISESHMTSGGIRDGDRGLAGHDPVESESGGSHERGRCPGPEPVVGAPERCIHGMTAAHEWPKAGEP